MLMLICSGTGTLAAVLWILCWLRAKNRFEPYIEVLDPNDYIFPELYAVGFAAMELFHINVKDRRSMARQRKQLSDLYGEQNVDFYLYIMLGGQISYVLTMLALGMLIGTVGEKPLYGILLSLLGVGLAVNMPQKTQEKYKLREENMQMQLPNVISTMALLVNAGMAPLQCWEKTAGMGSSELYREMQESVRQVHSGVSLAQAVQNMGDRSSSQEVKKFCSTFRQNLKKGDAELVDTLLRMNDESWEAKRNLAKRRGELAGQKLLGPTMIMFVGLMLMIIVPILGKMGF